MFPPRHTWPVLTSFIHIIRNTRFRGFCCSWIKVESQKDCMGTSSWYIEGLVLFGGWSVLYCKEFVQCQSVKVAPNPTVIHFGKEPYSDKYIAFLRNRVKMPGIPGLELPVSFLWHCIDVIIAAFSGKLVRWPFLSCFFKALHRIWMTDVLSFQAIVVLVKGVHCLHWLQS